MYKARAVLWLMAFTKSTGIKYGLTINSEVDERYSYVRSTEQPASIFWMRSKSSEAGRAAAAFNRGMDGMSDAVRTRNQ
jgi:hypothetical protein